MSVHLAISAHGITAQDVIIHPPQESGTVAVLIESAAAQLHFTSVAELVDAAHKILDAVAHGEVTP